MAASLNSTLEYLRKNAEAGSTGKCAKFIRLALQAGSFNLDHPPVSAKDYGPTLAAAGFVEHKLSGDVLVGRWACKVYQPSLGDIAVIPAVPGGGPHGHISMFDGQDWYSDFKQNDMWGGPKYRQAKPTVQLFKYPPQ